MAVAMTEKKNATSTITETQDAGSVTASRIGGALEDVITSCLTLVIPMCALTAAFLAFVFHYQVPTPEGHSNSAYYVNYSATRLITVSSWTSTAASLIAPFAMTMLSYPIARSYQRNSVMASSRSELPTPYQLGLIIGMLSGGVGYVWQHTKYSFWTKKPRNAGILNTVTAGASTFIILTIGILAADTWLHITTSTVPYGVLGSYETLSTEMSRGLNGTCMTPNMNGADWYPCIQDNGAFSPWKQSNGLLNPGKAYKTLANISTQDEVRMSTIEDMTMAYLIDSSSSIDMDYEASTFGLSTTCEPISRRCDLAFALYCDMDVCPSSLAMIDSMVFSCPGEPGLEGNLVNGTSTATTDLYGSSYGLGSNIGFFLQFFNDSDFQIMHFTNLTNYTNSLYFVTGAYLVVNESMSTDPDVISNDYSDASGVLFGCTATGFDLDIKFTNGSVASGNATKANDTIITNIGFAMSLARMRRGFQPYLENGMLSGSQQAGSAREMADYFAQAFSRVAVGITSSIMSPRTSIQQQSRRNVLVTRLPMAPFYSLLLLNILYALCGLLLGIWALGSRPRATRDVQARLSIAGLIASLLEPKGRPVKGKGIEGLFGESNPDRLDGTDKRVFMRQVDHQRWSFEVSQDSVGEVKLREDSEIAQPHEDVSSHHLPLLSLTGDRRQTRHVSRHVDEFVPLEDVSGQSSQSAPLVQRLNPAQADAPRPRIARKPLAGMNTSGR